MTDQPPACYFLFTAYHKFNQCKIKESVSLSGFRYEYEKRSTANMPVITLYGISNCDTTKKAMALLKKNKIDFSFHDYKQLGISRQKLETWCSEKGWENIFNKRSTTWRELPEAVQQKTTDQSAAIKLMMENNSIIKRPILEFEKDLIVGFNETEITKQLKQKK
jgi:Spx/MgsR family transcriptional regulator